MPLLGAAVAIAAVILFGVLFEVIGMRPGHARANGDEQSL
jgi:hypothetical protein